MLNKSICIFILLFGICHANIPSWIKAPATTEKSKPADAPKNSEKSENSKPTKPPKKKKQKTKNSVLQVENIYQTVKLEPPPVDPGIFSLKIPKSQLRTFRKHRISNRLETEFPIFGPMIKGELDVRRGK